MLIGTRQFTLSLHSNHSLAPSLHNPLLWLKNHLEVTDFQTESNHTAPCHNRIGPELSKRDSFILASCCPRLRHFFLHELYMRPWHLIRNSALSLRNLRRASQATPDRFYIVQEAPRLCDSLHMDQLWHFNRSFFVYDLHAPQGTLSVFQDATPLHNYIEAAASWIKTAEKDGWA